MRLNTIFLPLLFSISILFGGTDGTIRGKVTDIDGSPLPGANVFVPDVGVGAAADMDGNYIILNIPVGENDVVAQMMGYTKERRVVTLLGPEGSGKSALAIATANYIDERSESFIDGIYFIRLAGVTGAELESTICEAIGYSTSKRKRLIQYMRKKSLLLVLDQVDTKLVSSKEFRSFLQLLLDKTKANVLFNL